VGRKQLHEQVGVLLNLCNLCIDLIYEKYAKKCCTIFNGTRAALIPPGVNKSEHTHFDIIYPVGHSEPDVFSDETLLLSDESSFEEDSQGQWR
jgi:hypothetical protein